MANKTVYPYGTEGSLPSSIGLVNDLKTGGVDKALTAEQGKVLGDLVYELSPIDLSIFGICPRLITASGVWASAESHKTVQIKVTPGEVYILLSHAANGSQYAFFSKLGIYAEGNPPYIAGETNRRSVAANREITFTIPEGCNYLYIALNNAGTTDLTPQGLWLRKEVLQVANNGDANNEADITALRGTWTDLFDYESATVLSNAPANITIEKSNGEIIIENLISATGKYAMVSLPALIDDYADYVDAIQQGSATVATTTKAVGGSKVSSLAFTVSGKPKMFAVQLSLASSGSYLTNPSTSTYLVSAVISDGTNVYTTAYRYNSSGTRAAREYYYTTGSFSYSNGTLTVNAGTGSFAANQTYRLIYVY